MSFTDELKELWPYLRPVLARKRFWLALLALVAIGARAAGIELPTEELADALAALFMALGL